MQDDNHTCHFMLEQNAKGYFTGNFICSYCGNKVAQAQLFDSLTVTSHDREPAHGLSRRAPTQNPPH
jgi:hypothetical protein